MKEITLGELLNRTTTQTHGIGVGIAVDPGHVGEPFAWAYGIGQVYGDTPEDALQAMCELACGPDALLDLGRSRQWEEAHGPDGVAGLCDGEAGIVVCRDGSLHLLDRMPQNVHFVWAPTIEELHEMCEVPANVVSLTPEGLERLAAAETRPCETSHEEESEVRSDE